MSGEWNIKLDTSQVDVQNARVIDALSNPRRLHELYVIQVQQWIFKHWPNTPPLSPLTLSTRRKGSSAVLLDSGMLRLSVTGASPATAISAAEGTLNAASEAQALVGTKLPYASIHQHGGVIRARNVKNLAIPMTTRARKLGSPRNWGEGKLQFIPSKKAGVTGLLVERSRARPFILHYVLTMEISRNGKAIRTKGKPFAIPVSKEAERAGPPSELEKDLMFLRASEDKAPTVGYLVEMKERKRTTAHYLLKPSVTIPDRPILPTEEQVRPDLEKVATWYLVAVIVSSDTKGGPGGQL